MLEILTIVISVLYFQFLFGTYHPHTPFPSLHFINRSQNFEFKIQVVKRMERTQEVSMKGWEGASTEEQSLVSKLFFILQGRETVSLGCDGSL